MLVFWVMVVEAELEIRIRPDSQLSLYMNALRSAQNLEILKFGSDGVIFLGKATPEQWGLIRDYLGSSEEEKSGLKVLSTKKDGSVVFLTEKKWGIKDSENAVRHKEDMLFFKKWQGMEGVYPIDIQVTTKSIQVIVVGSDC
jgi:hypothetical protein